MGQRSRRAAATCQGRWRARVRRPSQRCGGSGAGVGAPDTGRGAPDGRGAGLGAGVTAGTAGPGRGAGFDGGVTAFAALIRPYCQFVPVPGTASAVVSMRSITACALVPQLVDQIRPASPATCGVAIEVPL